MEQWLAGIDVGLRAMGGGVAVAFIISIAAGILAMTLLYVGSALLVLDQFARVSKGWLAPALAGMAVSIGLALLVTMEAIPSDSVYVWSEWRDTFAMQLVMTFAGCVLFIVLVRIAMHFISQHGLTMLVTGVAAGGVGLALSGTGNASLAPSTLGASLAISGLIWGVRTLKTKAGPSTVERLLWISAAGLAPGAIVTMLSSESREIGVMISGLLLAALAGVIVLGLIPLAIAGFVAMRKSVEWFIAIRYLFAQRRQVFISAITAICVGGIAVGVWLIIVVLSVMNGFEQTWRDEILGNRAHFTVHSSFGPFVDHEEILDIVESTPGVEAASP